MARKSRAAAQAAAASIRTPTPQVLDVSEDDVQDASPSGQVTPPDEEGDDQDEEDLIEEAEEDVPGTPANDSEVPTRLSTPARGQSSIPRKRRAGRPPKNRPRNWDALDEVESRDGGSEIGTPKKRGGWRGGRGFGGGRWGKPRGGPSHTSQIPLDKEGNKLDVEDDEIVLPEDLEGETKVDKMGRLQDGREYRVRTFTVVGKGNQLFMLSTEPARCIGFRDSYLFFQKHKHLFKIILPEEAKRDLIEREIIPHSYKGRAIGVVTARSVYREFGAKIVIGGRKITDDYEVAVARARGDIEGEIAVPEDKIPPPGQEYDRNQYVAWHGASSVYHSGAPSVPMPNGKITDGKKRKVVVTGVNWMFEHAREASRFNSTLTINRRRNLAGVYDPHTNHMHVPKIMEPTHARWELLPSPSATPSPPQPTSQTSLTNGIDLEVNEMELEPTDVSRSIFPGLAPIFERNFMIIDSYFTAPPLSALGVPGPDGDAFDLGPVGLVDVPDHVLAELPEECLQAFEESRAAEMKWKSSWKMESADCARAQLRISYNGIA